MRTSGNGDFRKCAFDRTDDVYIFRSGEKQAPGGSIMPEQNRLFVLETQADMRGVSCEGEPR